MKTFSKRSFLPILSGFLILISGVSTTHAIIDTNDNGLSDLWEKTFNNGALFTSGITAQQDSDSDGWTNEKEAAAGTNPFIANPPEGIIQPQTERIPATYLGVDSNGDPAILTPETQTVTWPTRVGKKYTLQFSPNLQSGTWLDVGAPILGEGTDITIANVLTQPDGTVPEKLFWRVVATDVDTDNDGLTNAEEHQLGTNPNAADSDGDSLNDKAEYLAGTNPLSTDSDLDGLADNVDSTPLANNAEADPDGAGLDPSLETNLIGRWDFEKIAAGGGLESTPASVGAFDIANTNASWDGINNWANEVKGMPWAAVHFTQPGAYGKLPASRFHLKSTETWAMWIRFPASALDNSNAKRTLFSLGKYLTASDNSRLPVLHAYFDGTGTTSTLNLETYWIGSNFPRTSLASWPIPANLDDGNWHHLAVTFGSGLYELYFDGVRTNFTTSNPLTINLVQTGSTPYALVGRYINSPPPGYETLGASLDRLRVYQSRLPVASILALYNQDIDRDGLFDRIEQLGRMWRDTNGNCVREAIETYYPVNPFRWVANGTDTEGDGRTDHQEQTDGTSLTNPDTDGDLMPDGWEADHGLNNKNPSDANLDPDGDGLSNLDEYRHVTNPRAADSDGDGTNDGLEVKGPDGNANTDDGSDPADNRDGGQPVPPEEKIALLLGVGDQSSSHSEDYVMNVFRIDPASGNEQRIYTLRSGGFGQYKEETKSFRREDTLTFQIDWQGSSLNTSASGPNEGPDYDYTFKVQQQGGDYAVRVVPYYDPDLKTTFPGVSLLGQKTNVTDFLISTESKRALVQTVKIDLAMDTNMNGIIESLPDGATNLALTPAGSTADRELFKAKPDYAVVIDVNNNNTDAANASSPTKSQADHANNRIDTQEDRNEIDDPSKTTTGHAYGRLRIWANPMLDYGMSWRGGSGQLDLRLMIVEPGGDQVIRVYDWQNHEPGKDKPEALLHPGKNSVNLSADRFFKEERFGGNSEPKNWYQDLAVEGLTYGQVTLRLEVVEPYNGNNVVASDEVKVTVNVDQFVRTGADLASKKDAIPLRGEGMAPHFSGIFDLNAAGTNSESRAVRGRIVARVPSANIGGWATQLTPMRGRNLRKKSDKNLNNSSGQSLWVGLRRQNGAELQWVQCGLRWFEESEFQTGTPPFAYLEVGAFLPLGKSFNRQLASPGDGAGSDGGPVEANSRPLQGWESERLVLDFILYKYPVQTDSETGADTQTSPWRVIFKDGRDGKNAADAANYILMRHGFTAPQATGVNAQFEAAYKAQKLITLDAKHETNLSIAFAPGLSGAKGEVANLMSASFMASGVSPSSSPSESNPANLWNWLDTAWAWNALSVPASNVRIEARSGERNGTGAAVGTTPHPYWRVQGQANGFQIWDTRAFGFGATN